MKTNKNIVNATYVSVWDGGTEIRTKCRFNTQTNIVSDIEQSDVGGVDILDREYVELEDGTEIDNFFNADELVENELNSEQIEWLKKNVKAK
jgi:hypothetical protein